VATGDASEVDGVLTIDGGVVEVGEVIFTKKAWSISRVYDRIGVLASFLEIRVRDL
jgi:hypothetical protein